jgi:hypothetical protein
VYCPGVSLRNASCDSPWIMSRKYSVSFDRPPAPALICLPYVHLCLFGPMPVVKYQHCCIGMGFCKSRGEITYLEHDHRVSSDDDHSNSYFFTAWLLLQCVVENDIQVDLHRCKRSS